MDSWTPAQLALMKAGGNGRCASFLKSHGMDDVAATPIKPKYESPAAQLYKEVLRARAEGRPVPTELPPAPAPRKAGAAYSGGGGGPQAAVAAGGGGGGDPSGMERLTGETDAQYVARQTRLRDEARARMAAKFGGGGGMGGGGGGGMGRMGGIGSDSTYDPSSGGYGGGMGGGEEQRRTWEPPLPRPSPRDLAWPWVLWGPRPGLRDRWWREPVRSLPREWPPRRQGPAAGWREDISRDWEDRWHRRRGGSGAASGAAWQRLPRP